MGCTHWQILTRIRLRLALPEILLGLNQTIMFALSMLVITALVGTRDLGQEVYIALTKADPGPRPRRRPRRRLHRDHRRPADPGRRRAEPARADWACERTRMTPPDARRARCPAGTATITAEPLTGGLSNESWKVTDAAGRPCRALRPGLPVPPCRPRARGDDGARRPCGGLRPGGATMPRRASWSSAFIAARTWGAADVRANARPRRRDCCGASTARCRAHVTGAGLHLLAVPRHPRLCPHAAAGDSPLRGATCRASSRCRDELEAAQVPLPIVFGHHDLLPANFLDDGERLWLIDYRICRLRHGDVRPRRRGRPMPA